MKNFVFVPMAILSSIIACAQQKNILLDQSFWKSNPDKAKVEAEIANGANPSASNYRAFDPVVFAITNDAPNSTIKFLIEQEGNSISKLTHDNRIYLHWASAKGNLEIIQYLIAKGSNLNLEDSHGSLPITAAAMAGVSDTAVYEAFFKAGIDPKKKYQDGANLLLLAIAYDKDLNLSQYFISKGMSLKDVDSNGNSAFNYAAKTGNIELLKTLRQKGIGFNDNALLMASQGSRRGSNGLPTYKFLVEDLKINPKATNKEGQNVLHALASKPNQSEIITYFIAKGVDVNKADIDGNTPLMIAAAARENNGNMQQLLALTKNINIQNKKGESALSMAIQSGTLQNIKELITKGADVQLCNKEGYNLAYYLIDSYRAPMQNERPMDAGNSTDIFLEKIKLLQQQGLNLSAPQKDGSTVYHFAIAKNDLALLKKIAFLNTDINAKNKDGLTALHKAAMISKDDSILKYLLSIGAKKEIKTEFDESPYVLAKENETLSKNKVSIEFLK